MSTRRRTYSLLEAMTMGEVLFASEIDLSSSEITSITLSREYDLSKELLIVYCCGLSNSSGIYNMYPFSLMFTSHDYYDVYWNSHESSFYLSSEDKGIIKIGAWSDGYFRMVSVLVIAIPRTDA